MYIVEYVSCLLCGLWKCLFCQPSYHFWLMCHLCNIFNVCPLPWWLFGDVYRRFSRHFQIMSTLSQQGGFPATRGEAWSAKTRMIRDAEIVAGYYIYLSQCSRPMLLVFQQFSSLDTSVQIWAGNGCICSVSRHFNCSRTWVGYRSSMVRNNLLQFLGCIPEQVTSFGWNEQKLKQLWKKKVEISLLFSVRADSMGWGCNSLRCQQPAVKIVARGAPAS